MSEKLKTLKAQAKNLHAALAGFLPGASLAQAQELLAKQYGATDWNTLVALASNEPKKPANTRPRLSEVPAIPDEIRVETGLRTVSYNVDEFDEELMALIDDPNALQAFFDNNSNLYSASFEDTCVIFGVGDGENLELTVADLQGAKGMVLGNVAYWTLKDGRIISFVHGKGWTPETTTKDEPDTELSVPTLMSRSSRGTHVTSVRNGLAVLPANMTPDRFHELLNKRLLNPAEAPESMVAGVCAQLGVQWLSKDTLKRRGIELAKKAGQSEEPVVINPGKAYSWLEDLKKASDREPSFVSFMVPVTAAKLNGPQADYLEALLEVASTVMGPHGSLSQVSLHPADPRKLPPLQDKNLQWVRVKGLVHFKN